MSVIEIVDDDAAEAGNRTEGWFATGSSKNAIIKRLWKAPRLDGTEAQVVIDENMAEFKSIAKRVAQTLEKTLPPAERDIVLEAVVHRLGKRVRECNDLIVAVRPFNAARISLTAIV